MALSLASIETGKEKKPLRVIIYGPHGLGKTSWAASAPSPIFIQTEDGMGLLEVPRFPLARSVEDVMAALRALYTEPHEYRTVVLDSLDWFEQLVHRQVRADIGDKEFASYGRGYSASVPHFQNLFRALDALRAKGLTIICTAHANVKRFDSPDVEPYDRYLVDLQEKAASVAEEWADVVLFANFKTYTTTTETGFGQKVTRGIGSGERVLYSEERPAFRAKNRYSLPPELAFPKEGAWTVFARAVNASMKKKPPVTVDLPPAQKPATAPVMSPEDAAAEAQLHEMQEVEAEADDARLRAAAAAAN